MAARKRVTIADVAKAAGVSATTVSFAFNNSGQVGADTVERVFHVARELGYAPSPIARALLSQRTGVIGILVPFSISASYANPFMASFMEGVGSVCDAHSLGALIVSPIGGSIEEAAKRALVDGYIVLGLDESHIEIEALRHRRVPFVVVDGDARTVSEVNVDDAGGAYAAALFLLEKGHRDILVLTFESPTPIESHIFHGAGWRRLEGYRKAFAEYGLCLELERVVQSPTSIEGGAQAFARAWKEGRRPTAVLALSDAMAIGVIGQAGRLGLDVPGDVEIIGFDDLPIALLTRPALSTVHQPIVEKGRIAAQLLTGVMEGSRAREKVMLPTRLVLRESTRR